MDLFNSKKLFDMETLVLKLEIRVEELEKKLEKLDKLELKEPGLSKL